MKPKGYKWAKEKEYYRLNREKRIKTAQEWNARHRAHFNAMAKARIKSQREIIVKGYGGICECCGEDSPGFLTIDHIFRDGRKDRQENKGTHGIYRRLIKAGFPRDRYRLLCMNCNWATRHGEVCPHQAILGNIIPTIACQERPVALSNTSM